MRRPCPSSIALVAVLVALALSALLLLMPAVGASSTVVPVGTFRSVTLRNGGKVTVRHASKPRVTLIEGTLRYSKVTIEGGDRLVIDRAPGDCPEGYELVVEVLAPNIDEVRVMDGGTLQTLGGFPRLKGVRAEVEDGGTVDLRSMNADVVVAAVHDGGRVFTKPRLGLVATIARGGAVTYWGDPDVTSSVEEGGVVQKGAAEDANKPVLDLTGPQLVPPVPPLPPTPPSRVRRSS